jgi:hypothetical protein
MRHICLLGLLLFANTCFANDGVLSEERVIRLPQDQTKWHVSVVGKDDAAYRKVLGWFDSGGLKKLRDQVHFHPVTPDMPIYKERYAPSIKVFPTVRVQDDKGVTVYEAAGDKIPMTGEGLYAAIASAVNGSEELLPWRRRHNQPSPQPDPGPQPQPQPDSDPGPIDNDGPPVVDSESLVAWPALIVVGLFLAALMVGQVEAWKKSKASK